MPGTRKVSERQWELLLQFMEKNPAIAKGSAANEGPLAKLKTLEKWKNIAARLNSEGVGCTKTHIKWREGDNAAPWPTRPTSPAVASVAAPAHPFLEVYESESPSLLPPPCPVPLPTSECWLEQSPSALTLPPTPSPPQYLSPPRYPSPLPPSPLPQSPLPPSPLPPSPPPPPDSAVVVMATPPTGAGRGRGGRRRGSRSDPNQLARDSRDSRDASRRPYHRVTPAAPDWVFQLEERSLVTAQGIAAALQELNVTLHAMRVAMESVAQSLQGISRRLDS